MSIEYINAAQWISLGAVIFGLPRRGDLIATSDTTPNVLTAKQTRLTPVFQDIREELPATHRLTALRWPDGITVLYARRAPVTDAWLRETHAEALARYREQSL